MATENDRMVGKNTQHIKKSPVCGVIGGDRQIMFLNIFTKGPRKTPPHGTTTSPPVRRDDADPGPGSDPLG